MPKHAVHAYVVNSVISRLCKSSDPDEREIGDIMRRNRSAAVLGSFGPDLHVWSPDYDESSLLLRFLSNLKSVVDRYNEVTRIICDSMDAIEKEDNAETFPVSRAANIEGLGVVIRDMVSSISPGLFSGIADGHDLFSDPVAVQSMIAMYLGGTTSKRSTGRGMADYKWSDRLHFWHSGEYARNLLRASHNDTDRAYAYGFMTHIATDLIVHQMVRKAIGGSYNKNPQGHFVCESLMDAWSYYRRLGLPLNGHMVGDLIPEKEMPYSIARLIPDAMAMTYGHEDGIDGYPSERELKETYARVRQYYELQDCLNIRKPKASGFKHALCDVVANYADKCDRDTAESIMEDPGMDNVSIGHRDDYRAELDDRLSSMGDAIRLACRQADAMLGLLGLAGDAMGGEEATALLCGIWQRAYLIVSETLRIVALMGFTIPEPESLECSYANGLLLVKDGDAGVRGPEYYIDARPFDAVKLKDYIDAHEKCDPIIAADDDDLGNAVDMAAWMISRSRDHGLEKYVFANWAMESEEL